MDKKGRILGIFYRLMRGEGVSIGEAAEQYGVSRKSISRDIGEIKSFLSEMGDVTGYAQLRYLGSEKAYCLDAGSSLRGKELAAIIKVLIGCRAFSKMETLNIIAKLKQSTAYQERTMIEEMLWYTIVVTEVANKI